jgi:hypothetical protein
MRKNKPKLYKKLTWRDVELDDSSDEEPVVIDENEKYKFYMDRFCSYSVGRYVYDVHVCTRTCVYVYVCVHVIPCIMNTYIIFLTEHSLLQNKVKTIEIVGPRKLFLRRQPKNAKGLRTKKTMNQ